MSILQLGSPAYVAVAAVLASTGCSADHPRAASFSSDLATAVRAAASAASGGPAPAVRYELRTRCGPSDQVLDGLTLGVGTGTLTAADGPAVLDRIAKALSDHGLDIERSSAGAERLHASPAGKAWTLIATRVPGTGELAIHASGVVDDESGLDGVEVLQLCG